MEEQIQQKEESKAGNAFFDKEKVKSGTDFFSYKVSANYSGIAELTDTINFYLNSKFESEEISDFNGFIEINLVSPLGIPDAEKAFLSAEILNNEVLQKIKDWIIVTGNNLTVTFKIQNDITGKFLLTRKTIREIEQNRKESKKGGCFLLALKFIYYLFFYGGGLTILLSGTLAIQDGKVNIGISLIGFSVILFSIPSIIKSLTNKRKEKKKKG
ncbi:hypothetical protein D0T49_01625 [Paludibacter sp. 221]|uniref:hypothetical protein n=1 Tax=Paludibacter sp. 221 TaxID=2302939 RepID=UPI0013D38F6C|nr:hypothetical protein [Paludibacter sp. 221]NDV45750.1 hypothetical protein [Paludibacter sp. 221]